jgi:hypothetical protein
MLIIYSEKRGVNFKWGEEKIRGVNIGGWLVLEPYVTRNMFHDGQRAKLCVQMDHTLDF